MSTATIRITHPDGRSEERTLVAGSYDIGREAGQLVLPDPNVSARHARLEIQSGRVVLVDLGSSNGSYAANGERLSGPHTLEPGQPLRLGGTTLTLLSTSGAALGGGTQVMSGPSYPNAQQPSAPYPSAPYPNAPYPGPPGAPLPNYPGPAGYGASAEAIEVRRLADRWMILAISSVFCGCGLPGIINIVLVSQAKGAIDQGDLVSARAKLGTVKLLCIIGWCVLAATLLFIVIVYGSLFVALLAGSTAPSRTPY